MGHKRNTKKDKQPSVVGYDENKERAYTRANLIAYYALGMCVDFAQRPEPKLYANKYLAQRLIRVANSNFSPIQWIEFNTDSLEKALEWASDSKYWYVSDLDEDTVITDDRPDMWLKHLEEDLLYGWNSSRLAGISKEDIVNNQASLP